VTGRSRLFDGESVVFLVSQIGARSSRLWTERLRAEGLEVRSVMLLWNVAGAEGRSQRELAEALQLPSSRVVSLVDGLEAEGWLVRRARADDRRANELYVTDRGRQLLDRVLAIAAEHEEQFARGLQPRERAALTRLLGRLAASQGLIARVHPDF
jgi:DNA-binding MarR family transcriptional regulator